MNQAPSTPHAKGGQVTFEKFLLAILLIITIILFSVWGFQAVKYLLALFFRVETELSFSDFLAGSLGVISSVLVFTASALWWNLRTSARVYFLIGSVGFIIKNFFDIVADLVALNRIGVVTNYHITNTASAISVDLLQAVFWIFVAAYFLGKIKKFAERNGEMPATPQPAFNQ